MSTPTTTSQVPSFTAPAARTNTKAILSLVFAFLFWPAGIIFGHLAHREIDQTGENGHGLATAGLVISYIGAVFALLFIVGMVAAVGHAAAISTVHGMGVIR